MKASEWIDRIKAAKGIESDYGAAKLLNLSRQAVSKYRSVNPTMNEETSIKVAELLGLDPAAVLLDQVAESTKDKGLRTTIFDIARRICTSCKVPNDSAINLIAVYVIPECTGLIFPKILKNVAAPAR